MNTSPFYILAVLGTFFTCTHSGQAQMFGSNPIQVSAQYESMASTLRQAAPNQYDFTQAMLGDVIRFLATDSGIPFISLPQDSPEASKLTTFSIKASPFAVLETVCRANELTVIFENGIFYFRPADDRELIGKSYIIKNNSLERVEKIITDTNGGGSGGGSGGGGSGGGGGGGQNSLSLQGIQETFALKPSEVIRDIRDLLGLPTSEGGSGDEGMSAAPAAGGSPADMAKALNSNELSNFRRPKVIWKSDSNTLYVVATRLQHMWVEGYIEAADKPQPLIALEVKFIETSRDPKREFGIDWGGTFEQGSFNQVTGASQSAGADGSLTTTVDFEKVQTNGGFRTDLANLWTAANLNKSGAAMGWPALGILSAQDINVKLRAMLRDEETQTTSYPRMVTLNNREVSIRSVVNQPVLGGSSSSTLGAGATTAQSISYLPIGTVLNILPKRMNGENILLNMAVTVSSIVGTEVIGGNPYPIASSRVYSAPVEVESGYTVAVGGLDEAREREGKAGVPFLQAIPILGKAFKYDSKSKNHKNLMLFITPTIINARNGGLPAEPQSIMPQRPGKLLPQIPQVDPNSGGLIGGVSSLPNAVSYLERETDILHHTIYESRITPDETRKLKELKIAIDQIYLNCDTLRQQYPAQASQVDASQVRVQKLQTRHSELARLLFSKKYF